MVTGPDNVEISYRLVCRCVHVNVQELVSVRPY